MYKYVKLTKVGGYGEEQLVNKEIAVIVLFSSGTNVFIRRDSEVMRSWRVE